ncbi:MAG: MoaD/ThiS family protein [Prochlorotrichaceae cyanobacterium]|jgi:molybdopterin synthase sulfur carrier subunit
MIVVTVKLFAIYQETLGTEELSLTLPEETPVIALLDRFVQDYPELAPWRSVTRFGINLEFVPPETFLRSGDEVVLIPPVSGG